MLIALNNGREMGRELISDTDIMAKIKHLQFMLQNNSNIPKIRHRVGYWVIY